MSIQPGLNYLRQANVLLVKMTYDLSIMLSVHMSLSLSPLLREKKALM